MVMNGKKQTNKQTTIKRYVYKIKNKKNFLKILIKAISCIIIPIRKGNSEKNNNKHFG
jgi:hypothetical protein